MTRLLAFTLALLLPLLCRADVRVQLDYGWDAVYRPGRWTPVFVTLSSDKPRQVNLELYAPRDRAFAMNIHETAAVGPQPTTIRMYAPLPQTLDELTVTARDATTGRTLGDAHVTGTTVGANYQGPIWNKTVTGLKLCIGVAGNLPLPSLAHAKNAGNDSGVGFLDLLRLPDAPIGYDSLDLLVLSAPDFIQLTPEQQNAIADWVRSGGKLVFWPGPDPVPANAPLAAILPCRYGPPAQMTLSDTVLQTYGLQSRFKKMAARALDPARDATPIPLLDTPAATAYRHPVGLGQVLALPFDASLLLLDDPHAEKFWSAVVGAVVPLAPAPKDQQQYNYAYQPDPNDARQDAALTAVMEVIGDVPGLGRFDFAYVAWSLIGLMLLVGPVDWFVLKKLGKQPWTWITTAAWVVLLTAAAVLIGQYAREGKEHFSTLQLVDEADGATVATTTVAAIYAPGTANYDLAADRESWWQPAAPPQEGYWGRAPGRTDVPFHQTYQGNTPLPQRINIWNQRFLIARTTAVAPTAITADLTERNNHLIGTITNNSDQPLTQITLTTRAGRAALPAALAPKSTTRLDVKLERAPESPTKNKDPNVYAYSPYAGNASPADYHKNLTWYASDLVGWRSAEIERQLATGAVATIHATVTDASPPAQLFPPPELGSHTRIIRSVVPLNHGAP